MYSELMKLIGWCKNINGIYMYLYTLYTYYYLLVKLCYVIYTHIIYTYTIVHAFTTVYALIQCMCLYSMCAYIVCMLI